MPPASDLAVCPPNQLKFASYRPVVQYTNAIYVELLKFLSAIVLHYVLRAEHLQLAGVEGHTDGGKLCSSGDKGTDGKDMPAYTCVCGYSHDCGCVVNGSCAMAASSYYCELS